MKKSIIALALSSVVAMPAMAFDSSFFAPNESKGVELTATAQGKLEQCAIVGVDAGDFIVTEEPTATSHVQISVQLDGYTDAHLSADAPTTTLSDGKTSISDVEWLAGSSMYTTKPLTTEAQSIHDLPVHEVSGLKGFNIYAVRSGINAELAKLSKDVTLSTTNTITVHCVKAK